MDTQKLRQQPPSQNTRSSWTWLGTCRNEQINTHRAEMRENVAKELQKQAGHEVMGMTTETMIKDQHKGLLRRC
jgi:hypothetical protein